MNGNSVEKLLRRKAEQLPKAEFALTEQINQQIIKIPMDKRKVIKPVLRVALAILSAVIITFSICFGVSAEFRDTVMSLFRATSSEIVPKIPSNSTDNNTIKLIGKQSIDKIADVSYYNLGGNCVNSLSDNIVSISQTDGSIKYYVIESDGASEITPIVKRITDTVELNGHTLLLDFEYSTLNGKPYYRNIEENFIVGARTTNFVIGFFDKDTVWVEAGTGRQASYNAYYFLYNLKTGEVTDVLDGTIPENKTIETITFSPDKQKLLLSVFNGGWPGEYIYFNAVTRTATSLADLTGIDKVYTCSFFNDNMLYITQYHNELNVNLTSDDYILSGYCYNLNTGEKINLFGTDDSVVYALHGNCIIEKNGVYKIITPSGDEYIVEGIDLGAGYDFLMNADRTKIAILNLSGKSDSLGISEIGIIDLVKKEIKIFERKGYEKITEKGIGWNDSTSLVVYTSNSAFYLYRFK